MFKNIVFLLTFLSIGVITINGSEYMLDEIYKPCPDPEDFHCAIAGVCIKPELECDGKKDCPDGSDEFISDCDFRLCRPPQYYICKDNNTCIVQNYRCDGHNDCPSNDDEENCNNYVPHHEKIECNENEFTCLLDNMCIAMELVCDGIKQCLDGSDEKMGCLDIEKKCKGFLCKNHHCLTDKSWICDGQNDCGDWSDEKNCLSNCTSDNKQFLCSDNTTCLPIEKVCDKKKDCRDGLDEGGICDKFNNNTACELNYCPANAECFIWPTGPVCVCPKGYIYNSKQKICEDIDECQTYGICSQGCVNEPGSYKCTCLLRFRLKNDNKTCESNSHIEPILLYAEKESINLVGLKSDHRSIVTDKVRQVVGLSFDGHFVYWTNVALNTESIVKARQDGTKMETLLTTGLMLPEDIAVDWITGNLYFTDSMYQHIAVCSNDGKYCRGLVDELVFHIERPRSITLNPEQGHMYWSEWGTRPMIAIAQMDGKFAAPFISDDIEWPCGTTLDWPNNRLYWVDSKLNRIESVNLDGSGRHIVIGNVLKHPYGLAVFENNIYWSDWKAKSVETCNKFTCKDRKTIVKDRKVFDIHVYHHSMHQYTKNPCSNNKCSHLCLLSSNETYSCECPAGMVMNADKISCTPVAKKESIYIGMRNYLITMEHEKFGRHQIEKAKVLPMYIHKMTYNLLNGHVFIADNIAKIIYDYELTQELTIELVKKNVGEVTSLAFDHLANNLYWSDSEHGTIEVLSLNKNQRATVYHYSGMAKPIAIAVIPEIGQMFVASKSSFGHTHIDMQSLHGGGPHHHLIESALGDGLIQFALDRHTEEVFWSDSVFKKISWTDYTGKSLHVFKLIAGEPVSLAILTNDVFWTKNNSLDVYWTPKSTPDTTKQLILPHHDYVTKEDKLVLIAVSPTVVVNHPCMVNNGNCSHICATYSPTQKICLCPPGMVFSNNLNDTCMEAVDCEFRCGSGECITASRQCNNINDCVDASDEKDCAPEKKEVNCYRDEFKCADGKQCIAQELRCDKTNDCNDKSDEADCKHYNSETKCHMNQFACPDGQCIDVTAICDDVNDCSDGADELRCHDKKAMEHVCRSHMFTCASGQCIPAQWVCDESPDCADGSDEHNCPEKACLNGYLKCAHGQCIDSKLVCDGFNNCGDNSDELNCTVNETPENKCEEFDADHEPLKFQCTSDKNICLNITARCNGTSECPRGEDEAHCAGCRIHEFECANKKCIRKEWRCDKQNDCGDRSDEIGCDANNTTGLATQHCGPGMFGCNDGNCIDYDQVCDGKIDCPNKMDESDMCATSCLNSPCPHLCRKSPVGPICSCREGFQLGGDRKNCFDINECKVSEPCAQICTNGHGKFTCSCYVDFMLRTDKTSCKSIGSPKHYFYSSLDIIYDITSSSLGILWSSNSSKISGMDVNVRQNLLYFTVQDTGALYEMNLESKAIVYVTNIGNPQHIAVDWVTNNVYFFDKNTSPSIKVCHMSQKVCVRIILLKYKDAVKSLVVDSANNKIFFSILHPTFSSTESFIYSYNLDGTRSKIIVKGSSEISGLSYDHNKQILYFADRSTSEIWSVKYDGTERKLLIKDNSFITKPSDLSFHEDHLLVLNAGSKIVAQCKTYGDRVCKSFELNAYNAENLVIVQESRQKEKHNNCLGSNCSLICVPAELGPKCLCHGGKVVQNGIACKDDSNDVAMSPFFSMDMDTKTQSNTSAAVTIFSVLAVLIGSAFIVLSVLYLYQRRYTLRKTFDVSMHFENPTSGIDNGEVKMCRQPQLTTSSKYNEIYVNTQEPIAPVLEEFDSNFTPDKESDTTRLIY